MEVKKCYIVCLTLLGLLVPLSLTSLDASALKHEYKGLPLISAFNPLRTDSQHNYFDWTYNATGGLSLGGTGFNLSFEDDAWRDNYNNLRVKSELLSFNANLSDNKCNYSGNMFSEYVVQNNWSLKNSTMTQQSPHLGIGEGAIDDANFKANYYVPDYWQVNSCYDIDGMTNFDSSTADYLVNGPYPSTPNPTGLLDHASGGYYKPLDIINQKNMLPKTFTQGQVNYDSQYKDTGNGVVYEKSLSFDKIFNQNIQSFSRLRIGLWDTSGYWTDDNNLYNGRQIDFHFNFRFYDNVEITQNFQQNGKIQLNVAVIPKNVQQNSQYFYKDYDCTSQFREIQLEDQTAYYWDITCPVILDQDYIAFVPNLVVDGQGHNVMNINSSWDFSSLYVVTDNDDTQGEDFNSDDRFINNDEIWDSYWEDQNTDHSGDENWFDSLLSLFNFNIINPFTPMFLMFTDQSECAHIPILASMLHAEEDEVCPMFNSNTRAILTPVFSIVSMMIIFGFAVHWLGGRSGNLIEDSTGDHSFHIGTRQKGGKKE